jgi:lysozyme
MKINQAGLELIKRWEGLKLKAYLCPANVPTIGYGHTGPDVTKDDVKNGKTITEAQAEELLKKDLAIFEAGVAELATNVNENQFSALVSFAYNCGLKNLRTSTLLKKIKSGDTQGAANEFSKWNKGGGKVLPGLVKRRAAEKELFLA